MAGYTETVEEKNPALVATGLALWGWSLRIVVGVSFIFLPLVITSVNPIVDNLPVADTVIHGQSISDFVAENHQTVIALRPRARRRSWRCSAKDPADGGCQSRRPIPAANIAAAEKAFGAAGLAELAKYKTQPDETLLQPYTAQLTFIQGHEAALNGPRSGRRPRRRSQWQHWFYVDLAGMVIFVPTIWLTKGRWRPSSGPSRRRRAPRSGADQWEGSHA